MARLAPMAQHFCCADCPLQPACPDLLNAAFARPGDISGEDND